MGREGGVGAVGACTYVVPMRWRSLIGKRGGKRASVSKSHSRPLFGPSVVDPRNPTKYVGVGSAAT